MTTANPAESPRLRVTRRCLTDDLSMSVEEAAAEPTSDSDHELVREFFKMRSQDPRGTEKVQPLENASEVYTLHAGRWRGATWHDRENDVVWLLAGGYHRSGEHSDAYPHFKKLDAAQRLAPTEADYELFFRSLGQTFSEAVLEGAGDLLNRARSTPGSEIRSTLAGTVEISVGVEVDDDVELVFLAVSMRLVDGSLNPPEEWVTILLAAFFPWVSDLIEEVSNEDEILGRQRGANEMIFCALTTPPD